MKKFLMMLALSATCLGAPVASDGWTYENMKVTATIMETLRIKVKDNMDFGKIAKGTRDNKGVGTFIVKGEKGAKVWISTSVDNGNQAQLVHSADKSAVIYARLINNINESIQIGVNGETDIQEIRMALDVPQDQKSGNYEGTILLSARYQ